MESIKFLNINQTSQKNTQMPESEDFTIKLGYIQESSGRLKDQIDGSGMSLGRKKGVRVSGKYLNPTDWDRGGLSIVHSHNDCSRPPSKPTIMSIAPHTTFVSPEKVFSRGEENPSKEVTSHSRDSCTNMGVSKQTMDELKSILRETSWLSTREKEEGRQDISYTYHHGAKPDGKADEGNKQKTFTTFKPNSDCSSRGLKSSSFLQIGSIMDSSSSCRSDRVRLTASRQHGVQPPKHDSSNNLDQTQASETDDGITTCYDMSGTQFFISTMEKVKQQIAKENIKFVRFEATDLHGVSRSKTVPVRFFHEKAVCGVPMPRSYLELTVSPKINEVDHASTANFSSDVILIPNLETFRVLPWAEQTARVICDPCTVTGIPLRTSPRLIAKQQLGQLQSLGFSLYSSFTYECCVLGAPDRVGPKTLMFPASTLLSNHDLPFYQQLVDGMYSMGADVDSFASASGPSQMEITLRPEFGITAADSAFTFRTGIKEMARKHCYIASFFNDEDFHNAGVLSHSLWDANGHRSLFQTGGKQEDLSEIGRKWLAGLLIHSAALSCLMSPGVSCRSHIAKKVKDPKHTTLYATFGCNDNSSSFNIKCHGGRETHIDNKLGSAMANPYVVLAATVAAGLDGIMHNLNVETGPNRTITQQKQFSIPLNLNDALTALEEDHVIHNALGEPFVQYFLAMKRFEIETQELDEERNKCLEYFI